MNRSFVSRFFLAAITMAISLTSLHTPFAHAAQPREQRALVPVPNPNFLPIGALNMSPANISRLEQVIPAVPVPEEFFYRRDNNNMISPILSPDMANGIIQSQVAPTAVSYLASYMKSPYILLIVGEGMALSYLLMGQQTLPQNMLPALMNEFQNQLPLLGVAAARGAVTAVAEVGSIRIAQSRYASYLKPLMIGAEVAGAASAYFSPDLTDTQKALTYAGVAASITPIISSMLTSQPQLAVPQKIKQGMVVRAQEKARQKAAGVAVALIAVGAAATTIQAWHEGNLSAETQVLAGVALSQMASLAQEWSIYEYSYRATKQVLHVGVQITNYMVPEPIKLRCSRLVTGMFNAFGWGAGNN
jgi:hypothetical protein